MEQGWVKSYREWMNNPYIAKDSEHYFVWMYLMHNATHTKKEALFGKESITLKAGQAIIKKRRIAEELKINREKVNRIISFFESVSLIVSQTNMHQTLITIELWASSQGDSVSQNVSQVCHQCVTEKDRENEKEKRSKREKEKEKEINKNVKNERIYISRQPTADSSQKEELFDLFWSNYPKKVGKGYARQCFDKLKPNKELVDTMIRALGEQKKSEMWKRDNGQYIPNPSTWLNQQRWLDSLEIEIENDNPWKEFNLGITL